MTEKTAKPNARANRITIGRYGESMVTVVPFFVRSGPKVTDDLRARSLSLA